MSDFIPNWLRNKFKNYSKLLHSPAYKHTIAALIVLGVFVIPFYHSLNQNSSVLGITSIQSEFLPVTDLEEPIISFKSFVLNSGTPYTDKFILSSEPIQVIGNHSELLLLEPIKLQQSYIYPIQSSIPPRPYTKDIGFMDMSGNTNYQTFFFNPSLFNSSYYNTNQYPCFEGSNFDVLTIQLDKQNCLHEDFEQYLVLQEFEYQGHEIIAHSSAYNDLKKMLSASHRDGIQLVINSSFRTMEQQATIRELFQGIYGTNSTNQLSAVPGHSEHHLGTAFDFSAKEPAWYFGDTQAYSWLLKHAWEYGFVLSYPEGKEHITGYRYEPWHWRYVGKIHAAQLRSLPDLTLREYLYLINDMNENSY